MSIKHFSSGENAKENKWQKKTVTATATTRETRNNCNGQESALIIAITGYIKNKGNFCFP